MTQHTYSGTYVVETADGKRLPYQSPYDFYDVAAQHLEETHGPVAAQRFSGHRYAEPVPHAVCSFRSYTFAVWHIEDLPEEATALRAA